MSRTDQNDRMADKSVDRSRGSQREPAKQDSMISSMVKSFMQWSSKYDESNMGATSGNEQRDRTIEPPVRVDVDTQSEMIENESSQSEPVGNSQRIATTTAQVHWEPSNGIHDKAKPVYGKELGKQYSSHKYNFH